MKEKKKITYHQLKLQAEALSKKLDPEGQGYSFTDGGWYTAYRTSEQAPIIGFVQDDLGRERSKKRTEHSPGYGFAESTKDLIRLGLVSILIVYILMSAWLYLDPAFPNAKDITQFIPMTLIPVILLGLHQGFMVYSRRNLETASPELIEKWEQVAAEINQIILAREEAERAAERLQEGVVKFGVGDEAGKQDGVVAPGVEAGESR